MVGILLLSSSSGRVGGVGGVKLQTRKTRDTRVGKGREGPSHPGRKGEGREEKENINVFMSKSRESKKRYTKTPPNEMLTLEATYAM